MLLIIVVAAMYGIWRCRSRNYFKWVGITFAWIVVSNLLFSAGGTLSDPSGDGLITRQVRIAASDGPAMGLFALAILLLFWGGIIYFIIKMQREVSALRALSDESSFAETEAETSVGRKVLDSIILLAAAAIWVFLQVPI
jgi:hypothetical protein